ncbi:hypothetical protein Droror1_Dr00024999 [Drosera rotundifolia]
MYDYETTELVHKSRDGVYQWVVKPKIDVHVSKLGVMLVGWGGEWLHAHYWWDGEATMAPRSLLAQGFFWPINPKPKLNTINPKIPSKPRAPLSEIHELTLPSNTLSHTPRSPLRNPSSVLDANLSTMYNPVHDRAPGRFDPDNEGSVTGLHFQAGSPVPGGGGPWPARQTMVYYGVLSGNDVERQEMRISGGRTYQSASLFDGNSRGSNGRKERENEAPEVKHLLKTNCALASWGLCAGSELSSCC